MIVDFQDRTEIRYPWKLELVIWACMLTLFECVLARESDVTGPRSEQLSADQLRLFTPQLAQELNVAELTRPEAATETPEGDDLSSGSDSGNSEDPDESRPRGRRPLPPHLKRERIEHDLPEAEKHCGSCDEDLRPIGEETSERYEYIPAQLLVIEDVCKKYACGCTVKTATKPPQPIEKSAAGASLLAQVIVGKIADHLPVHRQAKIFRRFGAEIPDQTMCGWMRQSAQLLDPLYARLKHFVLSSKVVGTDDTPVKVLDRNLKRTTLSAQLLALTCRAGVGEPCRQQPCNDNLHAIRTAANDRRSPVSTPGHHS
jgi:transposase